MLLPAAEHLHPVIDRTVGWGHDRMPTSSTNASGVSLSSFFHITELRLNRLSFTVTVLPLWYELCWCL
jgi:hypothetical protein